MDKEASSKRKWIAIQIMEKTIISHVEKQRELKTSKTVINFSLLISFQMLSQKRVKNKSTGKRKTV